MSKIVIDHVTKIYPGDVKAADDVSLEIASGEFMVLVGPSGCGKSTLMRMVAGLEDVTEGAILIDERDVTELSPRDRDIAMVFQNYALYPHMTVRKNLGYGLKVRKTPKPEVGVGSAKWRSCWGSRVCRRAARSAFGGSGSACDGATIVREPAASSWTSRCRTRCEARGHAPSSRCTSGSA
jgi:ABC-type sugar transport system ATPase subunit